MEYYTGTTSYRKLGVQYNAGGTTINDSIHATEDTLINSFFC